MIKLSTPICFLLLNTVKRSFEGIPCCFDTQKQLLIQQCVALEADWSATAPSMATTDVRFSTRIQESLVAAVLGTSSQDINQVEIRNKDQQLLFAIVCFFLICFFHLKALQNKCTLCNSSICRPPSPCPNSHVQSLDEVANPHFSPGSLDLHRPPTWVKCFLKNKFCLFLPAFAFYSLESRALEWLQKLWLSDHGSLSGV